jgi:hypothetical protein
MALAFTPPVQSLFHGPAPLSRSVTKETPWEVALALEDKAPEGTRAATIQEGISKAFGGKPFHGRVFASETTADYLLWRWQKPLPTNLLVDTHNHLFDMEFWGVCMQVKGGARGWDQMLERWRVNLIVVETTNTVLCAAVRRRSDWQVLVDEGALLVAVRKKPLPSTVHD